MKNSARCYQRRLMVLVERHIVMKLKFYRYILEKCFNIKLHENPSSGSRIVPSGQTDKHDEANSRFSQYFERF